MEIHSFRERNHADAFSRCRSPEGAAITESRRFAWHASQQRAAVPVREEVAIDAPQSEHIARSLVCGAWKESGMNFCWV